MSIKTYDHIKSEQKEAHFGITRMEKTFEKRNGKPDTPHRHDFYTVILVKSASGKHIIDFNEYPLHGDQIYFIGPGQVHQIIEDTQSFGFAMVFSEQFLINNHIPIRFIEDLNLFQDYGQSPPLKVNKDQFTQLEAYCSEIEIVCNEESSYKDHIIGSLLKLFLIKCNQFCTHPIDNTQAHEAGQSILKSFKALVDNHFHEWHGTTEYAEQLHITPDHLNRTVKSLIGKTAKEYIQSRIIISAKRLLMFSAQSTKEIAYELGFSEPANFSAFYKNCTNESPQQFRNRQ